MSIRKGLHRIVILISCAWFVLIITNEINSSRYRYSVAVKHLDEIVMDKVTKDDRMATKKIQAELEKWSAAWSATYKSGKDNTNLTHQGVELLGWKHFEYQDARDERYSIQEIGEYLCHEYSGCTWMEFIKFAKTEESQRFHADLWKGVGVSVAFSGGFYLSIWALYFCFCWIGKGFKHSSRKGTHKNKISHGLDG